MKALKNKQTEEIEALLESTVNQSLYANSHDVVDIDLEGDVLTAFINDQIRPTRDVLLKETDAMWIEKSSKGEDLTALNAYKQALRDFPENVDLSEVEYVDQIIWPTLGE